MTRFKLFFMTAFALTPASGFAQAYKCTVDGQVVFQQIPCPGGKKLDVATPPDPDSREARISSAIAQRRVFIGMTEEEVVRSWGKPNKINRSVTSQNINEQWIYDRKRIGDGQYLYIENGVLKSIQSPE
jgi:Domain of unknown function (DUF4124)/Protein of unknown function (DUF2845)